MHRNIFAWTAPGTNSPEFVSINCHENGTFTLDARGPATLDGRSGETVRVILPVRQLKKTIMLRLKAALHD